MLKFQTPTPLNDVQKKEWTDKILTEFKATKEELSFEIVPELLLGYRLITASKVYDHSFSNNISEKLKRIQTNL
jgi:F0F1-type ATP synthase delta subunit